MPPITGRAAIAGFWRGAFSQGSPVVDFQSEEVVARDDMAYERGVYSFTAGGETERGKYLAIWFRDSNGVWRIHRDAWNATPAGEN